MRTTSYCESRRWICSTSATLRGGENGGRVWGNWILDRGKMGKEFNLKKKGKGRGDCLDL